MRERPETIRVCRKNIHASDADQVKSIPMKHQRRIVTTFVAWILIQFGPIDAARAALDPSTIFKTKCSSCHTFGKGDHVGPDLKGVTARHRRPWLIAWIRSSETQIRHGDAEAEALFRKYRQQRMPDHDLSDVQIAALLDYLDAGGPAADERSHLRLAADATPQEVQLGRNLFFGEARLTGGAVACVFCHTLSKQTVLGGSLAPDLSGAYTRYLDWALDQTLRRPCVPRAADPTAARVADAESLALRAFLRSVGAGGGPDHVDDRRNTGIRTVSGR
jgi:mono/diheme cytochrome c family protein